MQTHEGVFKTKYRNHLLSIIDEYEICHVKSRMSQAILRNWSVDYRRHIEEEARKVAWPRWYLKKLELLLP